VSVKVKISFTVSGTTNSNIIRRANQVLADYLECPIEEVNNLADVEIQVNQRVVSEPLPEESLEDYLGNVFARIK
jgi:hypothetical protein